MKNNGIGIMRGAFDPPHKGHLDVAISSFIDLTIKKLIIIVKFIGEKDMSASVQDRIHMMNQQLDKYDLPIEVLRQNVLGHTQELIELRQDTDIPIINICGSDKSKRELELYGRKGDIFGINKRNGYSIQSTYEISKKMGIDIVELNTNPESHTSSTHISKLILNGEIHQDGLDENVSGYIEKNGLYLPYNEIKNKQEFILGWFHFLEKLIPLFPNLQLLNIEIPDFNSIQSKNAWREKYIRTIVKYHKLKGDILVNFVSQTEKIEIAL